MSDDSMALGYALGRTAIIILETACGAVMAGGPLSSLL